MNCSSGPLKSFLMSNCRAFGSEEGMRALFTSVRTRDRREGSRTSSRRNQEAAGMALEFVLFKGSYLVH